MGLLRGALIVLIAPGLASCAAVAPSAWSFRRRVGLFGLIVSSFYSFIPFFSSFASVTRRPGDEVRIEAVPIPSAPDQSDFSGVAALESLTHYWGDPADWRDIAREIVPPEGDGATPKRILVYLNRGDYEAQLRRSSLDAVRDEIQRGRPVLLFLKCEPAFARHVIEGFPVLGYPLFGWLPRNRHVLLVVGYDRNDEYFLCHSGNDTQSLWRHDELDRCWARTSRAAIFALPKSEEDSIIRDKVTPWTCSARVCSRLSGCASESRPLPEAEARAALARGTAFESAGDLDKAEAAYREAARCEAVRPLALADRANVLAHQGECGKAEKLYRESIRLRPTALALNNLAWMYVVHDRKLDEAVALATRAAEIAGSPDAAAACYHTAGLASGLKGDLANAALLLRKGADLQMQGGGIDGEMAFDLARYLLLAERPEEALKALDQSKPAADPAQAANLRALRAVALRRIARARRSRTASGEDAAAAFDRTDPPSKSGGGAMDH